MFVSVVLGFVLPVAGKEQAGILAAAFCQSRARGTLDDTFFAANFAACQERLSGKGFSGPTLMQNSFECFSIPFELAVGALMPRNP